MPILKTRLYKPFVNKDYIIRERLIVSLNDKIHQPLRIVVAGAGYGKSVTVGQWLNQSALKYCWISLERDCNDLLVFLSYLAEAVNAVVPGKLMLIKDMLFATNIPSQNVISEILINELESIDEEINIVLDDYHFINNNQVHDLINDFLQYPSRNIKLTIISRFDPPLKLNKLITYDRLGELRMKDLKLTIDEIKELSGKMLISPVDNEIAESIYELTEGWIIGVKMLFRNYSNHKNEELIFVALEKNKNHFIEFLFEQFLSQFPVDVQKCMMIASCFNQFNTTLIKLLCPPSIENNLTKDFEHYFFSSTFIVQMDDEKEWYRFHQLVQDFLQQELKKNYTKDEISEFYKIAGTYYASVVSYEEALKCYLKAGDVSLAVKLIEELFHDLMNKDQISRLDNWLNLLPAGTVEGSAFLLLARAYMYDATADYVAMAYNLESALALMPELDTGITESVKIWAIYYAAQSASSFYTGDLNTSIESSQKALELFASQALYMRDVALFFYIFVLHYKGRGDEAIKYLEKDLAKMPKGHRLSLMRNKLTHVMVYALQGKLQLIKNPSILAKEISNEESLWIMNVMANYYLASVNYLQNNLDEVPGFVTSGVRHGFSGRPYWVLLCYFVEGFRLLALEKYADLNILISEMYAYTRNFEIVDLQKLVTTFEIEVALKNNNIELAKSLAPKATFDPFPIVFYFYIPQLTKVKLMLYDFENNNLEETKKLIEQYIELGTNIFHTTLLIQSYSLLALWHLKYGDKNEALTNLKISINLAKDSGNVRNFLDLGDEMSILFNRLSPEEKDVPFVKQIIKTFHSKKRRSINSDNINQNNEIDLETIDELSEKELEILRLVAMGFQNKEIAEKIFLSPATIKTYLYRIYGKLGVKNRIGAVTKTKQLYPTLLSQRITS